MIKKQGVALIWALVLSAILLIISATMVTYITQESRFSVRIAESATAYSYARSGIEWANRCLDQPGNNATSCSNSIDLNGDGVDDDLVVTTIDSTDANCDANFCISSTGMSNNVTRKLEHKVNSKSANLIELYDPPQNVKFSNSNTESFEMSFRFWGSHSSYFGVNQDGDTDNLNNPYLAMRIQIDNSSGSRKDNIMLEYKDADGNPADRSTVIYDLLEFDNVDTDGNGTVERRDPYEYRATIRYIKDTAASLKVCRVDSSSGSEESTCLGGASVDLVGKNLGNLNSLFVYDSGEVPDGATTTAVNYSYKEFVPGTEPEWSGDGDIILGRPETCNSDDTSVCGSNVYWMIYDSVTVSGVKVLSGYVPSYTLSVNKPTLGFIESVDGNGDADGNISCGPGANNCSFEYDRGTTIKLNARPADPSTYTFTGWSGGGCSGTGSCDITMGYSDVSGIAANFDDLWINIGTLEFYDFEFGPINWASTPFDNVSCSTTPEYCTSGPTYYIRNDVSASILNGKFPAQYECLNIGGRLPTKAQLSTINSAGLLTNGRYYWSNQEYGLFSYGGRTSYAAWAFDPIYYKTSWLDFKSNPIDATYAVCVR